MFQTLKFLSNRWVDVVNGSPFGHALAICGFAEGLPVYYNY